MSRPKFAFLSRLFVKQVVCERPSNFIPVKNARAHMLILATFTPRTPQLMTIDSRYFVSKRSSFLSPHLKLSAKNSSLAPVQQHNLRAEGGIRMFRYSVPPVRRMFVRRLRFGILQRLCSNILKCHSPPFAYLKINLRLINAARRDKAFCENTKYTLLRRQKVKTQNKKRLLFFLFFSIFLFRRSCPCYLLFALSVFIVCDSEGHILSFCRQ